MKKTVSTPKEVKRTTTNYPRDSHKEFCRRCMARHGKCPNGKKCDL